MLEITGNVLSEVSFSKAVMSEMPVDSIVLTNTGDRPLEKVRVVIDSKTDLLTDLEARVPLIPPGSSVSIDGASIKVNIGLQLQLTEAITDTLFVYAYVGEQEAARRSFEIKFYAYDQWLGSPETLPAFITPNHPQLAKILVAASNLLKQWKASPELDGYQSADHYRVVLQAAAIYQAIQDENIIYIGDKPTFEPGQRVRLCDDVINQHLATNLDLALLYASCLEAISLRPFIVLMKQRVLTGVWLWEESFSEIVEDSLSALRNRLAAGVERLVVIDPTYMASGYNQDFDQAERSARDQLEQDDQFEFIVDVARARASAYKPIPLRVMGPEGYEIEQENNSGKASAPSQSQNTLEIAASDSAALSKIQYWENSLLDLSTRNKLINMKLDAKTMVVYTPSIDDLENQLAKNSEMGLLSRPSEMPETGKSISAQLSPPSGFNKLLLQELKNERLRTPYSPEEMQRCLTSIFRGARSSIEETGVNTLFLAMGVLKWKDAKARGEERFAPIMLFPLTIDRKSANTGYTISLRDDEPQINVTLLEMLRLNYGIEISGLDPLPQDDAGVDTRKVLNTIRNAIMEEAGWEVLETAVIGLFSFSSFVMWNDIKNHANELRKSKIVNSLIEGHLTWDPFAAEPSLPEERKEIYFPVDTDASQEKAIAKALSGDSFVLHGPPGTGKSQTITAIIANAIAKNKKVLFVAEKRAALEVVQRRLASLGLDPFCLEVHSTKATKSHILAQINAATEVKSAKQSRYMDRLSEYRQLQAHLDAYAKALSSQNGAELSLREQICRYEHYSSIADAIPVSQKFVSSIESNIDFQEKLNVAERAIAVARQAELTSERPLSFVNGSHYTQALAESLPEQIEVCLTNLRMVGSQGERLFADIFTSNQRPTLPLYTKYANLLIESKQLESLPLEWLVASDRDSLVDALEALIRHTNELNTLEGDLLRDHTREILAINVGELRSNWIDAEAKILLGKYLAEKRILAELNMYSSRKLKGDDVPQLISKIEAVQDERNTLNDEMAAIEEMIQRFVADDGRIDCDAIQEQLEIYKTAPSELITTAGRVKQLPNRTVDKDAVSAFIDLLNSTETSCSALWDSLGVTAHDGIEAPLNTQINNCAVLHANLDKLRSWMDWNLAKEGAKEKSLDDLTAYLDHSPVDENTFSAFRAGVYRAMCSQSLDAMDDAGRFTESSFSETINQFKRADKSLINLAKNILFNETAQRTPDLMRLSVNDARAANLQKYLRSRARSLSIRKVFTECGDIIFDLCPCALMSPLSVAQYLEAGSEQFDLLIFDEASQLQTCKAVGALSRAKAAVIVGDQNQMPPTTFFQGTPQSDDDEDLIQDLDSILDDALALHLPEVHLEWHYRSRHESLIAFSNSNFYDSKLHTFPSFDDRISKVTLEKLDGVYARKGTHTNMAEAEAIIRELERISTDPVEKKMSVGVVTFNINQQNLIDDMLQNACSSNRVLDKWRYQNEEEPLFIKNLENVQGDERDIILFSVTYGQDATGKTAMNFGPLNKENGWKRLNVAVTRARCAMKVFTIMDPEDIDLDRTSSRGASSLRAFLDYARRGSHAAIDAETVQRDYQEDEIAKQICAELSKRGYSTETNIGRSDYRVDIGVKDPHNQGAYIAGVLLDGNSYSIAESTRDREITQVMLLENLGWEIYRIWTLDWYENKQRVLQRLVEFLEATAASKTKKEKTKDVPEAETIVQDSPQVSDTPVEIEQANATYVESNSEPDLPKRGRTVHVDTEQRNTAKSTPRESATKEGSSKATSKERESITTDNKSQERTARSGSSRSGSSSTRKPKAKDTSAAGATKAAEKKPQRDKEEPAAVKKTSGRPIPSIEVQSYPRANPPHVADQGDDIKLINNQMLARVMEEIIEIEAPLVKDYLFYRVVQSAGGSRVGSAIREKLNQVLKTIDCKKTKDGTKEVIWKKSQNPDSYFTFRISTSANERRGIRQLPQAEIRAGIIYVLQRWRGANQDELERRTVNELGYSRVTDQIRTIVAENIEALVKDGVLLKTGNFYKINVDYRY